MKLPRQLVRLLPRLPFPNRLAVHQLLVIINLLPFGTPCLNSHPLLLQRLLLASQNLPHFAGLGRHPPLVQRPLTPQVFVVLTRQRRLSFLLLY